MTYLLYCAWIVSIFMVAGEVDELLRRRFGHRFEKEFAAPISWYLPPMASVLVPGAGQFLNRQPVKALLVFLWPVMAGFGFFPRPWQTNMMSVFALLLPWYALMLLDALFVAIRKHRETLADEAPPESKAKADEMVLFLERYRSNKNQTGS